MSELITRRTTHVWKEQINVAPATLRGYVVLSRSGLCVAPTFPYYAYQYKLAILRMNENINKWLTLGSVRRDITQRVFTNSSAQLDEHGKHTVAHSHRLTHKCETTHTNALGYVSHSASDPRSAIGSHAKRSGRSRKGVRRRARGDLIQV